MFVCLLCAGVCVLVCVCWCVCAGVCVCVFRAIGLLCAMQLGFWDHRERESETGVIEPRFFASTQMKDSSSRGEMHVVGDSGGGSVRQSTTHSRNWCRESGNL